MKFSTFIPVRKTAQMRVSIFIFLSLLLSLSAQCQEIIFCKDFTPDGKTIGASSIWESNPGGNYIRILYKQGKAIDGTLTFTITGSLGTREHQPVKLQIKPAKGKSLAGIAYRFSDLGKYEVKVSNNKGLSSTAILVITLPSPDKNRPKRDSSIRINDPSTAFYYQNSKIRFSERVLPDGSLQNETVLFYIGEKGGYVTVTVESPQALATEQLLVYIYKKRADAFTSLVSTKSFNTLKDWKVTDFKLFFTDAGEYNVKVYSKANVFINEAIVRIKVAKQ